MRIVVAETAREAFWFLVAAALSLMGVRLIALAFDAAGPHDALAQAVRPFQRGYWLGDPCALVPDGMGPLARLGVAALAALLSLPPALLPRARAVQGRAPRLLLRAAATIIPAALLACAVAVPRAVASISPEGVRLKERAPLLAGMGIPGTAREFMYAWSEAEPVLHGADGPRPWIELRLGDRQVPLQPPGPGADIHRLHEALASLKREAKKRSP
ncbi:MAG: hypothetical protein ACK4L7_07710 [Flavobacteriales bacterium]